MENQKSANSVSTSIPWLLCNAYFNWEKMLLIFIITVCLNIVVSQLWKISPSAISFLCHGLQKVFWNILDKKYETTFLHIPLGLFPQSKKVMDDKLSRE